MMPRAHPSSRVGDDSVAKYPGLNIKGGSFRQDNFIAIKVDRGDLFLNGGTITSANSYAIENWFRTTIKGGTVNGYGRILDVQRRRKQHDNH